MKTEEIKLSAEQEKVLTKAFKKESLRLFVDDCLQDELEQGLILLGKQGTVWVDQPGGIKQFSEGINGITTTLHGEPSRIAYAITNEKYFEYSSAFPCNEELNSPTFCFYQYPNTLVKFGNRKLFPSTFTQDLQQYLLDRTAWCVHNFILSDVSAHAKIVATDIELELTITDEGIGVKVDYPLKFKVGGEEIFSLSTFDFFYPSHFNQLLDTAASPLRWEQELVDFNYTEETFVKPTFSYGSEQNVGPCVPEKNYFQCERALALDTYQSLGMDMNSERRPNGDDIFTFTPALYEIVDNPEPYSLRIARQNRPPALDYLQRASCPAEGYDYLVIKDDPERGDINLIPHAIDPDEDRFTFLFSPELGEPEGEVLHRTAEDIALNILNGFYTITTTATDEHGKADSQDVRVLVDRPIRVGVRLEFPEEYSVNSQIADSNRFVVSKEDPIIMEVIIPEESLTSDPETLVFNYNDGREQFNFGGAYRENIPSTEFCYNLPLQEGEPSTCNILYYDTTEKFTRINDPFYYDFPPFQRSTSLDSLGQLTFNFHQNYCGLLEASADSSIEVLVKDCVPLLNAEHPFAYPYHGYIFDAEGNFVEYDPASINPFAATHSCCLGDPTLPSGWRVKTAEEGDCFTNPLPGCYGRIEGYTTITNNKGYILEEEFAVCDGSRGNICGGGREGRLPYDDELRCGTNGQNECHGIADKCQNQLAFGIIDGEGWCHGRMGCAGLCMDEVVYTGSLDWNGYSGEYINSEAKRLTATSENVLDFHCGCTTNDDGQSCDKNFDERFDSLCDAGECKEKICPPDVKECNGETETDYRDWRTCSSLGTEYDQSGSCEADEYCSEGICEAQKCLPKELICYPGFLNWVGREYPDEVDEIEAEVAENPAFANYPFFCNEKGSEYDAIEAACSPECSAGVTVVEVSDEEWRCGACRESDWRNERRCLKDGVRGECAQVGRTHQCVE